MTRIYKIVEVPLETVPFTLMIYQLPESELDDRLSSLTELYGEISRDNYCNFLIANCVLNKGAFILYVNELELSTEEVLKVKEEVMGNILDVNPRLLPTDLVISSDHVVRIKTHSEQHEGIPLCENKYWKIVAFITHKPPSKIERNARPGRILHFPKRR